MLSRLLDRIEARVGRHKGIRNLMMYIVIGTLAVYIGDYALPVFTGGHSLSYYLYFDRNLIMHGQVWRLLTFLIVPVDNSHILLVLIGLYFDWLMGEYLQSEWGTFRFTLFYASGYLGALIVGMMIGYTTSYYLNMSLMLAMALLHPNMPLHLYGILEIKIKWLALFSVVMMVVPLVQSADWRAAVVMAISLVNVLIYFIDRMIGNCRNAYRRYKWKQNWRGGWKR